MPGGTRRAKRVAFRLAYLRPIKSSANNSYFFTRVIFVLLFTFRVTKTGENMFEFAKTFCLTERRGNTEHCQCTDPPPCLLLFTSLAEENKQTMTMNESELTHSVLTTLGRDCHASDTC